MGSPRADLHPKKVFYLGAMCEQRYHGVVATALGRACWKTYVGLPDHGGLRHAALAALGVSLMNSGRDEEALAPLEADYEICKRIGCPADIISSLNNYAAVCSKIGQKEKAAALSRKLYAAARPS